MLIHIRSFLFVSLILLFTACRSSKDSSSPSADADPDPETSSMSSEPQMLASIERTACYGQCPMYKTIFMDNGEVLYVGKRFVDQVGTYSALLDQTEVLEIRKKVKEYDYFALDSLYPTPISDFPSCITEVQLDGRRKKVVDRRSPPDNLKSFEKFLDSLMEGKELKKLSDNTNYNSIER